MKILVTGAAGFIGYHLCKTLLAENHTVIGIDNINDYYDVKLKYARLEQLGILRKDAEEFDRRCISTYSKDRFIFIRMNLEDRHGLPKLFEAHNFETVCNLAAQAGVRYSLENPEAYVDSNIVGFVNLLECCRHHKVGHLVYASSSSVYGLNKNVPFSTKDRVDKPISLYAASKKSNELMAHTYSHLFGLTTTGLRFFTVYGPWGRPDMAIYLFTEAILNNKPIKVFNNGDLKRDFTYVDDIVEGVKRVLIKPIGDERPSYKLYNIGNNKAVKLLDFIEAIEEHSELRAKKEFLPMQPGDVFQTWADVGPLKQDYGFSPDTSVDKGVKHFVAWYRQYCSLGNKQQLGSV